MTTKKENPGKRGRKPLPSSEQKPAQFSTRMAPEKKAQLVDLSELYGLSLSQTIELCVSVVVDSIQASDWEALERMRQLRAVGIGTIGATHHD